VSHSFYIRGVDDASLQQTIEALPFDDLVVTEQTQLNGGWPEIAHIYQDNVSVRAIETAMEGDMLQVRVMAYSSPEDFQLAAAIVDHVASKFDKEIEPEDNESMSVDRWREEFGEEWQREQARTYLQMLVSMYKGGRYDGNMKMWGTRQELEVGPRLMEPLLRDPDNFTSNFFDRFRRLNYLDREDVFGPSLLAVSEKGSDKQAVFSVLGDQCVTALSNQAVFVALTHDDPDSADAERAQTVLTFDDFVDVAGDSLTWLGDGLAVTPQYVGEQWQALVAAAQEKKTGFFDNPGLLRDPEETTPPPTNGAVEDGGDTFGIPEDHWHIVAHSVVATFLSIATADGSVDKKELAEFQRKIVQGAVGMSGSEIMPRAMMQAAIGFEERLQDITQREATEIAQLIAASRQIVAQHAGEEHAEAFARALYEMAESIASASGGFFGFGSKIDKNEKMILDGLKRLLQLDEG
jgi:hypothetical protein